MNRTMTVAEAEAWVKKAWDDAQKAAWQDHVNEQKQRADELAKAYENGWNAAMVKRQEPIHDMKVFDLADQYLYGGKNYGILEFARAIEKEHGIGASDE